MELSNKIKKEFAGLHLDEPTHIYTLGNEKLKGSVSGLIKNFHPPFPEDEAVAKTIKKTGKDRETILAEWKATNLESIARGNRVHIFGEHYAKNRTLVPTCPQEIAVKKFWDDLPKHIILVDVELMMYHKQYMFPGTADILLYDTIANHYIIADYKTNKDIHKNFAGNKMLAPFEHLLDSPLNHYQIQFSFYQILLEQLGIQVGARKLIFLKMDSTYEMWDTEDLTPQLKIFLKDKYENI